MQKEHPRVLTDKATKVVQYAEFLVRMAEALIFNAATLCFAVNESTFKRFDSADSIPG